MVHKKTACVNGGNFSAVERYGNLDEVGVKGHGVFPVCKIDCANAVIGAVIALLHVGVTGLDEKFLCPLCGLLLFELRFKRVLGICHIAKEAAVFGDSNALFAL